MWRTCDRLVTTVGTEDCKVPSFLTHRVSAVSCCAPRTLELLATDFRATYAFAARETVITSRAAPPSCSSGWRAGAGGGGDAWLISRRRVQFRGAALSCTWQGGGACSVDCQCLNYRPACVLERTLNGRTSNCVAPSVAKQQDTVDNPHVYNATDGQKDRQRETEKQTLVQQILCAVVFECSGRN